MTLSKDKITYTRDLSEQLNFFECVQLVRELVKNQVFMADPNIKNNVIVFCNTSRKYPKGIRSENILNVATSICNDFAGQVLLRNTLNDMGVTLSFLVDEAIENCAYAKS